MSSAQAQMPGLHRQHAVQHVALCMQAGSPGSASLLDRVKATQLPGPDHDACCTLQASMWRCVAPMHAGKQASKHVYGFSSSSSISIPQQELHRQLP